MRKIWLAVFLLVLSGCASIRYDQERLSAGIAEDLASAGEFVVLRQPVRYGSAARGGRFVDFRNGVYVQTSNAILIYRYASGGESIVRDLSIPLTEIESALYFSFGTFERVTQLQIYTPAAVVAVNFGGSSADGEASQAPTAYAELRRVGVPVGEANARIIPAELLRGPMEGVRDPLRSH